MLFSLVKDIMHVNAIISFTAVPLEIKFTKLFFLVWDDILMFKLALVPLHEEDRISCFTYFSISVFKTE